MAIRRPGNLRAFEDRNQSLKHVFQHFVWRTKMIMAEFFAALGRSGKVFQPIALIDVAVGAFVRLLAIQ